MRRIRFAALICLTTTLGGCAIEGEYGNAHHKGTVTTSAEACPDAAGPFSPWPPLTGTNPPAALEGTSIAASRDLGEVAEKLKSALARAGYRSLRFYSAKGGFALATGIEKIDDAGTPLSGDERHDLDINSTAYDSASYFAQLFSGKVGLYREFVFIVSTDKRNGEDPATYPYAEKWSTHGCDDLSSDVKAEPLNSDYRISAFSYIFSVRKGEVPQMLSMFPVQTFDQLSRSGINF